MIRKFRGSSALKVAALAATSALVLTACSSGNDDNNGSGDSTDSGAINASGELRVWAGSETPIVANFNPFAPTALHAVFGPIYETLFYYNKAGGGDPTALLGESFEWNEDGTELTIKTKTGVKWSDGEDFTANDVAFTFNLDAAKPTYLTSVEATDDTTVVMTFDSPQFTNEFALVGGQYILPEHIWKDHISDQLEWTNETPIGTGPYQVDASSESSYTLVPNQNFREPDSIKIAKVIYVGIDGNQSAQDLLASGQIDWAGMFIADATSILASGSIGTINTPQDPTVLYTCANVDLGCEGPQTDVAVRQAINLAIDRTQINELAFAGHAASISPAFTLMPRDAEWLADGQPEESPQTADVDAAKAVLEEAGYTLGADGIYEKDGVKVELSLLSVDGWTDYNDAAKLIEEQAIKAGIKINAITGSWNEFSDGRQSGNYQLIMGGVVGASIADPFSIYHDWFTTDSTNPVGEQLDAGDWNFTRYSNAEVDAAVTAASQTNDDAAKKEQYAIIQEHIVNDLPYIPIVTNATQTWFNTAKFTGWPTEDNLYAFPPSWAAGGAGIVLTHISPVG